MDLIFRFIYEIQFRGILIASGFSKEIPSYILCHRSVGPWVKARGVGHRSDALDSVIRSRTSRKAVLSQKNVNALQWNYLYCSLKSATGQSN